jgi:uncharacterized protein (TIGR04255 family)
MSAPRSYKRPPVAEAAIELRFSAPISQKSLERAATRFEKEYPIDEIDYANNINVDAVAKTAAFSATWQGIKRSSLDRTDVIIFRIGTLVTARLAPYKGWGNLFERTKSAWLALSRAREISVNVSHIGVRYINRIDVPTAENLFDYVNLRPQVAPFKVNEGSIKEYSSSLVYNIATDDLTARLVAATGASPLVSHRSIIVDIDVFRANNLPRRPDDMWALLERMRDHKNTIFETCITDRARELFEQ